MKIDYGDPRTFGTVMAQRAATIEPIPRVEWPGWANLIAVVRSGSDTGIGDTVARVVGPVGGVKFKKWHRLVFGRDCACEKRREQWNAQYPYAPVEN